MKKSNHFAQHTRRAVTNQPSRQPSRQKRRQQPRQQSLIKAQKKYLPTGNDAEKYKLCG